MLPAAPAVADHPESTLSRRTQAGYVIILGMLAALGPFTIDLYLPAFPALVAELHTSETSVQLTLTAAALGIALGQFLSGPLSDSIGRRIPLVVATGIHVIASVLIMAAPTIEMLAALRVLQGFGAAAGE